MEGFLHVLFGKAFQTTARVRQAGVSALATALHRSTETDRWQAYSVHMDLSARQPHLLSLPAMQGCFFLASIVTLRRPRMEGMPLSPRRALGTTR